MTKDWTDLLMEPLAIRGAYQHHPPSLSSFAPHSVRIEFDDVYLAGQFMELPKVPPKSWFYGEVARAYVVFRLSSVRELQIEGVLTPHTTDDCMHGLHVGETSTCQLEECSDLAFITPNTERPIYWKRLTMKTSSFSLVAEATHVHVTCGRRAGP